MRVAAGIRSDRRRGRRARLRSGNVEGGAMQDRERASSSKAWLPDDFVASASITSPARCSTKRTSRGSAHCRRSPPHPSQNLYFTICYTPRVELERCLIMTRRSAPHEAPLCYVNPVWLTTAMLGLRQPVQGRAASYTCFLSLGKPRTRFRERHADCLDKEWPSLGVHGGLSPGVPDGTRFIDPSQMPTLFTLGNPRAVHILR